MSLPARIGRSMSAALGATATAIGELFGALVRFARHPETQRVADLAFRTSCRVFVFAVKAVAWIFLVCFVIFAILVTRKPKKIPPYWGF